MVFVKRQKGEEDEGDLTVAALRGVKEKNGHVGIEVEVESNRICLPKNNFGYWEHHRDGSLRGADNAEYVLARPIDFDKVDEAVDQLWAEFKKHEATLVESNRTSVHVHLNVMPFYQNRLVSLMCLWFICEDVLSRWCGDSRVGNLFAIRAKDGHAIITQLQRYIENKGRFELNESALHYSAFNVAASQKLGSVEVRTLRGVLEPEPIKLWVNILRKLYDASERYTDPRTIMETFSMEGPMDFFRGLFEEHAEAIAEGCGLNSDELRMSLFEGCRHAQDLAYARDWSDFNPKVVPVDPFGRKPKKSIFGQELNEFVERNQRILDEMEEPMEDGRSIRTRAQTPPIRPMQLPRFTTHPAVAPAQTRAVDWNAVQNVWIDRATGEPI